MINTIKPVVVVYTQKVAVTVALSFKCVSFKSCPKKAFYKDVVAGFTFSQVITNYCSLHWMVPVIVECQLVCGYWHMTDLGEMG